MVARNRFVVWLFVLLASLAVQAGPAWGGEVREPVWAGRFYPADRGELSAMLAQLCQRARQDGFTRPGSGSIKALVLPHAGYIYAGPTAAHAALVLEPGRFAKVILIGPDHRIGFNNGAVSQAQGFRTPLGLIPLHADSRKLLAESDLFRSVPASDRTEHSLEVPLPLLQFLLGPFALVPIALGPCKAEAVARELAPLLTPDTLLVVSSDLSHFMPYAQAVARDHETIDQILHLDAAALAARDNAACGLFPLEVLIRLAKKRGWQPVLLHYSNSGDTAGDRERVVGYAAIAFFGDDTMHNLQQATVAITAEQGATLLRLARQTIALQLGKKVEPARQQELARQLAEPVFRKKSATFVTLHRHGDLRGCIGSLAAVVPLADSVRDNADKAAFHDPRFSPLTAGELNDVELEVSILTDPQPLAYSDGDDLIAKLRPKVDGVILRQGFAGATFLPQVWDQLPRPEDFLSHLCRKAGLPADAWKGGKLEVHTYQVQYFSE